MRKLSRERRLAVIAASLASATAGSTSIISRHAPALSDGTYGLLVGIPLGISMILLGVSITYLSRGRCDRPGNPQAS